MVGILVARRALVSLAALFLAGCAQQGGGFGQLGAAGPAPLNFAAPPQVERVVVRQSNLPAPRRALNWRDHFSDISRGAILIQLDARRLSYWGPGGQEYREFPIGVPRSEELERRGRTTVVRRRRNPDWRPTPSMLERNPELPPYVGPGPENPMGEHALYLGWTYYAIHGTNHPPSIGQRTTSGCFRLFPEHIAWLFDRVETGAPVLVVDHV